MNENEQLLSEAEKIEAMDMAITMSMCGQMLALHKALQMNDVRMMTMVQRRVKELLDAQPEFPIRFFQRQTAILQEAQRQQNQPVENANG